MTISRNDTLLVTLAIRLAVGLAVLFLAVNFATGPGAPAVVRGQPALVAHASVHFTTWTVYWLNLGLFWAGFLSVIGAVVLRLLKPTRPAPGSTSSAATPPILIERFISSWVGDGHYDLQTDAELTDRYLELRMSLSSRMLLRVPLSELQVIWFVHKPYGWKLFQGDSRREVSMFQFIPRNPRRWLIELRRCGIPVRPSDLNANQLPTIQPLWIAEIGCFLVVILVVLVAAIAALLVRVLSLVRLGR